MNGYTPPITNRTKAANILARLKKVAPHDPRIPKIADYLADDDCDPSNNFVTNLDFVAWQIERVAASQPVDADCDEAERQQEISEIRNNP